MAPGSWGQAGLEPAAAPVRMYAILTAPYKSPGPGRDRGFFCKNLVVWNRWYGVKTITLLKSTDYLLGKQENKKAPTDDGERSVSDAELKFALWGNCEDMDDDDLADVRRYAAFVRERKKDRK